VCTNAAADLVDAAAMERVRALTLPPPVDGELLVADSTKGRSGLVAKFFFWQNGTVAFFVVI
jgi:hypothetical protein